MQSKVEPILELVPHTVLGVSKQVFQLADECTKMFNHDTENQKLVLRFAFNTYY